jgi:hypothetical protein
VAFNAKVEKLNARMIAPRDRLRHLAAAAGWIILILPLAVVLLSVAVSPASNWAVRTTLAGFCILAVVQPAAALLVTIALVGFGIILSVLAGVPHLRGAEVLVVASLAGCCVRALRHGLSTRADRAGLRRSCCSRLRRRVHHRGAGLPGRDGYASTVQALLHF